MNAIAFDADGTLSGAACWRADGTPIGMSRRLGPGRHPLQPAPGTSAELTRVTRLPPRYLNAGMTSWVMMRSVRSD